MEIPDENHGSHTEPCALSKGMQRVFDPRDGFIPIFSQQHGLCNHLNHVKGLEYYPHNPLERGTPRSCDQSHFGNDAVELITE